MTKKTSVLIKVLRRLGRYIPAVIVSLLLATVYVAMSLYIPILVGQAIDHILEAGKVAYDAVYQKLLALAICAGIGGLSQWVMTLIKNNQPLES